jgi:hypothetical protein
LYMNLDEEKIIRKHFSRFSLPRYSLVQFSIYIIDCKQTQ